MFKDEIVNLYSAWGKTAPELSKQFSVPASTIYVWLRRAGINPKETERRRQDSINQTIKTLYLDSKLSPVQIAGKVCSSATSVRRRIKLMGIGRSRKEIWHLMKTNGWRNPKKRADDDVIADLFLKEKLNVSQIAKKLGYAKRSGWLILHRLRKMGLVKDPTINQSYGEFKNLKPEQKEVGGYLKLRKPEHPRADSCGYVWEHIVVWEEYHHRSVPKGYVMHHLNGIKSDNRPQNLVAMKAGEHIHQGESFKKRIRELEIENRQLKRALENSQMIFYLNEN